MYRGCLSGGFDVPCIDSLAVDNSHLCCVCVMSFKH